MKQKYIARQGIMILNQLALIGFLCSMKAIGAAVPMENIAHIALLSVLFWDAYYVSIQNVKGNQVLSLFTILLILFGWHFGFSLFREYPIVDAVSIAILPICLYQLVNFVQAFLFQGANYKERKFFLYGTAILCLAATISYFIDKEFFYRIYNIQCLVSFVWCVVIVTIHRERVWFVLRNQKNQLIFAMIIVLFPFVCYTIAFSQKANYVEHMGLYLIVMLAFVSIHSIIFGINHRLKPSFLLNEFVLAALFPVFLACFVLLAWLFDLSVLTFVTLLYFLVFWGLIYHLLLFWKASKPGDKNQAVFPSFYKYTVAQLKHEETLRKEFSNYLHDDILQDILSMKNLVYKAEQKEVQQLLEDILRKLTISIRSQMQAYHPKLLQNLTFKENLQNVLDSIINNGDTAIKLDCRNDILLVEPYTMLITRFARELTVNSLKHSQATRIDVKLQQEHNIIILTVSDNGIGFSISSEEYSLHHGLTSIQDQVTFLSGRMTIKSNLGGGTIIRIMIPMKGDESYASFVGR